jgi:hypothetical protein
VRVCAKTGCKGPWPLCAIEIIGQCWRLWKEGDFVPILGKICGIVRQQVFYGIAAKSG